MVDLAIIIVSYKTRELLDRCLTSIFTGEYPFSYRVTVVDNASDDGTPEMVVGKHPDALLIRNNRNVGYSVANNQGIRKSDSRHILLLNPDTEVRAESLAAMLRFLDEHAHVGVVGCQLLNSDGSDQTSWFSFPVPLSRYFEKAPFYPRLARGVLKIEDKYPEIKENGACRVDIIKGACLMIRRTAANQVGLLDENSFLYADDIDWCIRTRRKGWETYALTGCNIIHHGYASTDQEPYITITSSRRSALYLYRKHYPFSFVAAWSLFIYIEILYKTALYGARVRMGRNDEKTLSRLKAYRELAGDIFRRKKKHSIK
ncbi:MAG: glycosyltransferase family 2 protein [bacterium]